MAEVAVQYWPILLFLIVAFALSAAIVMASRFLAPANPDREKISAYECGFEPVGDARSRFGLRYYLVALLFVVFDLEVAFLFPWAVALRDIGILGFSAAMIFLLILTIGFIYEWKSGALEWE